MTTISNSNANIIERLGGERDFQFIVMALVDRLQEDRRLAKYFGKQHFDTNDLTRLQEEFLKSCFTNSASSVVNGNKTNQDKAVVGHITVRYYALIDQGFNERHFDKMVQHFVEALEDAWIDDQNGVIADAVSTLNSYRHIFERRSRRKLTATLSGESLGSVQ